MKNDQNAIPFSGQDISEEAAYFYCALFREQLPENIRGLYCKAHAALPDEFASTAREAHTVTAIMRHALDPVGIEPWLRKKNAHHLLTRKLLLLAYLHECGGGRVSVADGRLGGGLDMFLTICGAAFSLTRGLLQKRRYGLL